MKITSFDYNNHSRMFTLMTERGAFPFPYAKCEVAPTPQDPIREAFIDPELGREAITYFLESGAECSVHIDDALDYNHDPEYMRDMLMHRMSLEALRKVEASPLSRREIIRRLGTSPAQFYRLIDTANYSKTLDQLVELLSVLDCDVDLVVRECPHTYAPKKPSQ